MISSSTGDQGKFICKATIWLSILLIGLMALHAAWYRNALHGEESFFFYNMVNTKWFYYDQLLIRYFDLILQIPSVIFLRVLPLTDSNLEVIKWVHSFVYASYPLIGLLGCYLILGRAGRIELVLFPLICHSLLGEICENDVSIKAPQCLALFWPAYFLLLCFGPRLSWRVSILFSLLVIGLALSYELSLVFLVVLLLFYLLKLGKNGEGLKRFRGETILPLGTMAISIFFLLSRTHHLRNSQSLLLIFHSIQNEGAIFLESLRYLRDANYLFIVDVLYGLLLMFLLFGQKRGGTKISEMNSNFLTVAFLAMGLLLLNFYSGRVEYLNVITEGVLCSRFLFFPKTALLALILMGRKWGEEGRIDKQEKSFLCAFAMITLLLSLMHNFLTTMALEKGDRMLIDIGRIRKGCVSLSDANFKAQSTQLRRFGVNDSYSFYQSVLVQGKKSVDYIVFMSPSSTDYCKILHLNELNHDYTGSYQFLASILRGKERGPNYDKVIPPYFDFHLIFDGTGQAIIN